MQAPDELAAVFKQYGAEPCLHWLSHLLNDEADRIEGMAPEVNDGAKRSDVKCIARGYRNVGGALEALASHIHAYDANSAWREIRTIEARRALEARKGNRA